MDAEKKDWKETEMKKVIVSLAASVVSFAAYVPPCVAQDTSAIIVKTAGEVNSLGPSWMNFSGVRVASAECGACAAEANRRLAVKGYKIRSADQPETYTVFVDYVGEPDNFQTYQPIAESGGEVGRVVAATARVLVDLLLGAKFGAVNGVNLAQSDAGWLAHTAMDAAGALRDPKKTASDVATIGTESKAESRFVYPWLVAMHVCYGRTTCAYAVAIGDGTRREIQQAAFEQGILKLLNLDQVAPKQIEVGSVAN